MQYRSVDYQIRGVAPLLMHNGRLADPQQEIPKALKQLSSKRDKTDADLAEMAKLEWYGSLYLQDDKLCLPGDMIEAMLIESAKKKKKGPDAKAGILCEGNFLLEYEGPKDIHQIWEEGNHTFTVGARLRRSSRVMRTRPIFRTWSTEIKVHYLDGLLNGSDVEAFLIYGGNFIGIGDWRPKFGRFEVIK